MVPGNIKPLENKAMEIPRIKGFKFSRRSFQVYRKACNPEACSGEAMAAFPKLQRTALVEGGKCNFPPEK
jgi:hypothetical protein